MYANLRATYLTKDDEPVTVMAWRIARYSKASLTIYEDLNDDGESSEPQPGRELVIPARRLINVEADF